MPRSDDDDGLEWGSGSDDPTDANASGRPASRISDGPTDPRENDGDEAEIPAGSSSGPAVLVVYGVLAGAYLLATVGWIVGVQRDTYTPADPFSEVMYQLGELLAILSPALWFGLALVLTRHRSTVIRVLWLGAGLLVVFPLPFLLSGGTA